MIIQCINCNKNFDVDSSLIPSTGRKIQCGSCNHIWFYYPNLSDLPVDKSEKDIKEKNLINRNNEFKENSDQNIDKNKEFKSQKKAIFSISKILSYIIVVIISFVAVILIIETFKSQLVNIFPGLELILYNLFESIKDVILFIKDLTI